MKQLFDSRPYSLISQSRILPCSLPTASNPPSGLSATLDTRPSAVRSVGQFLYTVQLGRCTMRKASRFHRDAMTSICPSAENTRCEVGVVS